MADPIGTIRREGYDGGHSIWVRMDPGYPDNQFADTEWTCIWSTTEKNIGERLGSAVEEFHLLGGVAATPAITGVDVQVGDRVEVLADVLYWTQKPVRGRITGADQGPPGEPYFSVEFDKVQHIKEGGMSGVYTHWSLHRLHFRLLEPEGGDS